MKMTIEDIKEYKRNTSNVNRGKDNKLADVKDVEWLYEEIKETVVYFKIEKQMGHSSFLIGKKVDWFQEPLKFIYKICEDI